MFNFFFIDDCFLFLSLPLLLCLDFFLPKRAEDSEISTFLKKKFFFHLRFAQFILLITLGLGIFTYLEVIPNSALVDHIVLHQGNFFFRKDALITFVNCFFTITGTYYLYLFGFVFSRTHATTKYHVEGPFLIVTALFSLRLFLLTNDLMLLALLVEISAFCSVILIGIQSLSSFQILFPIEAAIKYFIINALAVALLLAAIVLYFALTNTVNVIDISTMIHKYPYVSIFCTEQWLFCHLIFFFSYFIKIGAAPVHQWVPDVYEGAETIVTAFLVLIVSPMLVLKLILLFKQLVFAPLIFSLLLLMFKFFGLISIIVGTLNAFYQTKIKRFIAYAGLTHLGFILLSLACNDVMGYFSSLAYLVVYYFTNIGFFTVLLLAQQYLRHIGNTLVYINQLKQLFQHSTFFFFVFLVLLLSFAGIPPFAGFFIKFFVLATLLNTGHLGVVLVLIVAILVGTFMYLRFLKIALFEQIVDQRRYIGLTHHYWKQFYTMIQKPNIFISSSMDEPSQSWQYFFICACSLICLVLLSFLVFLPLFTDALLESSIVLLATY